MIKRILVANRGEIAVRVMRSCREMEITSIAIFSEADRTAKHVLYADEAYCVGPAASKESYLNIEKIIEVAKANHADAIHPGYGFLSENAAFARRCQEEGIIFIGPNPETMEAMGDKISARIKMIEAGVPVVPGTQENLKSVEEAVEQIAKGLNQVLNTDDSEVRIALETMAGKGSEVGRNFEELQMIYDKVERKDRLRVCFDTCHVNDAGYDLVNDYEGVLAQFDRVLGLDQIAVIHVNDSLNPLGSHKDRHANIGQGTIGYDTLHRIVHDERFAGVPKILETPWLCAEGETKKTIPPYKQEIAWLLQ